MAPFGLSIFLAAAALPLKRRIELGFMMTDDPRPDKGPLHRALNQNIIRTIKHSPFLDMGRVQRKFYKI
jgi:hypothetical protein